MGRYRIEYTRNKCIGAFACVSIDTDTWAMNDDNKADLVNGQKVQEDTNHFLYNEDELAEYIGKGEKVQEEKDGKDEIWVKEVDELGNLVEGARACPVNVIKIIDTQTGEVLAP